jgi:hypothetical protein
MARRTKAGEKGEPRALTASNECFSTRKGESLFFTFPLPASLRPGAFPARRAGSPFGSLVRPRGTFLGHQFVKGHSEERREDGGSLRAVAMLADRREGTR